MIDPKFVRLAWLSYIAAAFFGVAGIIDVFIDESDVAEMSAMAIALFLLGEYFWGKAQP